MKKQNVRTLSFIVSTFTYLLIGAAIFDALESQTEESTRIELENTETDYKLKYNISNEEYKLLEDVVIKYHPYRTFPQWKFTGAFYFSLTVVTTIGYGHSTPQTIFGKIFCMLYAIVGIPLCLVMFQSVGERLNYFSSFCIQLAKKCTRIKNTEVNQTEMVFSALLLAIVVIAGGAAMFSHYEGWSYFDSIYYCVVTLTTIGFGDFVALQNNNNLSNTVYVILTFAFILFGFTVVSSSINLFVLKFLTMNTDDERKEYSRKNQEKNDEKLRLSTGDIRNTINGNIVCTYEPNDIEELKKENALRFCFKRGKPFRNVFGNRLKFIKKERECGNKVRSEEENDQRQASFEMENKQQIENEHFSSVTPPIYVEESKELETNLFNNKKKKTHYTVRRGPTQISHLLTSDGIKDSDENIKKNDNSIDDKNVNQYIDDDVYV